MTGRDPYEILGIASDADERAIRSAYRSLARRYHPDHAHTVTDAARMVDLNEAWSILRDPVKRADYDRARTRIARRTQDGQEIVWRVDGHGTGGGGPPPGHPSGSILPFGRYIAWSLGEVVRADPGYLIWLEERRDGHPYREEIERLLRSAGIRKPAHAPDHSRRRRG